MEMIIEIKTLDEGKINELKKKFENYKIKDIKNDIEDNNEIRIIFDKKRMKLNKDFSFKVELIRNKYYRQLLNLVNAVKKIIIKEKEEFTSFVDDILNIKEVIVNSKDYNDMLKMALINYIGTYNFDNIFELTEDEMLKIRKYKMGINNKISDEGAILDALGMYCHYNERTFKMLEANIGASDDRLEKIKECNNFILICPELIQKFCIEKFSEFKGCGIRDSFELNSIIFDKVLTHEIGHGVFDYIDDNKDEKRANYFVSLTFDGTFDKIIKTHTYIQDGEYKDPYLIDDEISTITKEVYNI